MGKNKPHAGEKMSFGSELRRLRDAKGLSRAELADRMNGLLSADGIKSLETDPQRVPRNGTLANLVKLFPELGTSTTKIEPKGYKYQTVLHSNALMR